MIASSNWVARSAGQSFPLVPRTAAARASREGRSASCRDRSDITEAPSLAAVLGSAAPPSQSRLMMYLLELSRGSDPPDELSSPNRAHPFLGVILKRSKNCRTEQRGHGSAGAASTIGFGSWTVGGGPHAASTADAGSSCPVRGPRIRHRRGSGSVARPAPHPRQNHPPPLLARDRPGSHA